MFAGWQRLCPPSNPLLLISPISQHLHVSAEILPGSLIDGRCKGTFWFPEYPGECSAGVF